MKQNQDRSASTARRDNSARSNTMSSIKERMAALQAAQSSSPAGPKPLTGGPPSGSGGGKVAALKANVTIPMTPGSGGGAKPGGGGPAKDVGFRTPGAASAGGGASGESGGKVAALRANMSIPTASPSASTEGEADDKPRSARSGGRIAGLRSSIAGSIPMAMPGMGPPPGKAKSEPKKPTKPEDYDLDRCLTLDRPRAPKDRKPPSPASAGFSPGGRPDPKKRGQSAPVLRVTETEEEEDGGDGAAKKSVPDID